VGLEAVIDPRRWPRQPVFDWLQATARIPDEEMYQTFNCGLGMTIQVAAADADRALGLLRARGEAPAVIGEIRSGQHGVVIGG
jgi:phosphoribosylformylglycinamidine cyclo-ligase